MMCKSRTLLIVTTCFATGLVGCGKRETPAPAVVEQKAEPVAEPAAAPNANPHNLFLLEPAVSGLNVEINGAVESKAGVNRIVWNWGDDTPEAQSWFPAKHLYEKLGTYEVRVTSHDEAGKTSMRTTTVKILPETPAAAKAPTENTRPAERSAVALIEQLGGTVIEDLNSLDKPIIKVSLRDRPVKDKGLKTLDNLKDLEELDLWNCREITNDGLVYLAGLTNLKKLVLWNTTVSGQGLEHIAGLQQLEILNVALCAKIGDDDLRPLGRLTKLRELDLASVGGITDAGLPSLKPLTHLRWLNLYNAKITDAGLEHLYVLTELETIVLNGTKVTDDGVEKLKAALSKLREIQR